MEGPPDLRHHSGTDHVAASHKRRHAKLLAPMGGAPR